MMKYQIIDGRDNHAGIETVISRNALTAPEIGVYTVAYAGKGSEVDFKRHLIDSMEQISAWLTNLKEHGFIDINDHEKKITLIQ